MLGAVGRCCTGALQALKPGVQPLKALIGSPAVLSRKYCILVLFGRIFFGPFKGVSDWADAEGQGQCLALAVASSTSANALGLDIKVSIWKFTSDSTTPKATHMCT